MELPFEALIDHLPLGVIVLDQDARIRAFNRYEELLSGKPREQVIGRVFFDDVAPCTRRIDLESRFREAWRGRTSPSTSSSSSPTRTTTWPATSGSAARPSAPARWRVEPADVRGGRRNHRVRRRGRQAARRRDPRLVPPECSRQSRAVGRPPRRQGHPSTGGRPRLPIPYRPGGRHGHARTVGSADFGNVTVLGHTVNLARRLQEAASPGEVILSDDLASAAGSLIEAEPVTWTLKGIGEVRAWRLLELRLP